MPPTLPTMGFTRSELESFRDATVPDLVGDLIALGARVHAVEPARISLEDRLLGILRDGEAARQ